jgi:hypothetical protein
MRWPLLVLALLYLAGCGGESGAIPQAKLSSLVLHDRDLPAPFASFYTGAQSKLDATSSVRADLTRFGRKGGWIARFHRAGSKQTQGPLIVVSRADLFGSSGNANDDLDAYKLEFDRQPGTALRELHPPLIGDETIGTTFVQPGALPVRYVTVAWRYRNVTAAVTVEGFAKHVSPTDAIRLARRQQRRISAP